MPAGAPSGSTTRYSLAGVLRTASSRACPASPRGRMSPSSSGRATSRNGTHGRRSGAIVLTRASSTIAAGLVERVDDHEAAGAAVPQPPQRGIDRQVGGHQQARAQQRFEFELRHLGQHLRVFERLSRGSPQVDGEHRADEAVEDAESGSVADQARREHARRRARGRPTHRRRCRSAATSRSPRSPSAAAVRRRAASRATC